MALGAAKAAILGAAGSGEAYLGMEVIAEGVLSGTATNIELASIPADFTNLELVFTGRTTNSYGPGTCRFTVNNDTTDSYGSNYGYR
jgi:hypothetical protein